VACSTESNITAWWVDCACCSSRCRNPTPRRRRLSTAAQRKTPTQGPRQRLAAGSVQGQRERAGPAVPGGGRLRCGCAGQQGHHSLLDVGPGACCVFVLAVPGSASTCISWLGLLQNAHATKPQKARLRSPVPPPMAPEHWEPLPEHLCCIWHACPSLDTPMRDHRLLISRTFHCCVHVHTLAWTVCRANAHPHICTPLVQHTRCAQDQVLQRSFAQEPLTALAASPGGAYLAAGGASGTLYVWCVCIRRRFMHVCWL
jgi:hypothetical protein